MGGVAGKSASILLSARFEFGLLIAAILWLLFVGEPKGVRHPIWRAIGWLSAGLFLFIGILTAGYGAFEIEIRKLSNERAIEIIKSQGNAVLGGSSDIQLSGPRSFSNKQILILISELSKLKSEIPLLYLMAPPNDSEANNYRFAFTQFLSRTGVKWIEQSETPTGPDDVGIMIAVRDPKNLPVSAQKLQEAFEVADIHIGIIEMPQNYANAPSIEFLLFFGPRPLL
jgi:hypothetical protein